MATPGALESSQAAYESVSAKIAEVLANPLPNITIDGVTVDRMTYYRGLLELQKAAREQMIAAAGPFEVHG